MCCVVFGVVCLVCSGVVLFFLVLPVKTMRSRLNVEQAGRS